MISFKEERDTYNNVSINNTNLLFFDKHEALTDKMVGDTVERFMRTEEGNINMGDYPISNITNEFDDEGEYKLIHLQHFAGSFDSRTGEEIHTQYGRVSKRSFYIQ